MVDIDTLLPERACSETSGFVAFDPAVLPIPKKWVRSIEHERGARFSYQRRGHTNHQVVTRLSKRWEPYRR